MRAGCPYSKADAQADSHSRIKLALCEVVIPLGHIGAEIHSQIPIGIEILGDP